MKKRELAVGLMSGTSADGITAALVEIGPRQVGILSDRTFPYRPALRKRVLGAAALSVPELSRLNMELGEAFAAAALKILRGRKAAVIGSHGQTVWHGPDASPSNTLQIAEPSVIAERTGIAVVADFRPRDIAAGGQGAPLVPAFEEFLFSRGPLRAFQNIGGIGNVSVVGRGRLWTAFDTGPGNALMDTAATLATRGRRTFDDRGKLARQGICDLKKVETMLKDPFFRRPPPKSLDRGVFGAEYLLRHFGGPSLRRLPDDLATLTRFTARTIEYAYRRFIFPKGRPVEIIVSGGGAKNALLMEHLSKLLAPIPVKVSDSVGLPGMAKEAACFAWMAHRALHGRTNNCPQATGARGRRILGKIVRP